MGRTLTVIAIALAVATTTVSVAVSVYFSTTAKAVPVAAPTPTPSRTHTVPPPPPLRDYWTQTHGKVTLPASAKRIKQVIAMTLPPGNWVLRAEESVYNKGPSDFVGCMIGDADTASLNSHRAIVGDPTIHGNVGPAPLMTVISETAAVSLKVPTRVFVRCEHDTARGASPYIDPGADLWAHQSAGPVRQES